MHHCEKAAGKLTSHSLKATLLQLSMLRRGINDQDRMVVGHHVSRVKMTLTYSRDAASRPLRVFEKLMGENSFRKLWPGNSFQIWPNQQAKARPGSQNKSHRIQTPHKKQGPCCAVSYSRVQRWNPGCGPLKPSCRRQGPRPRRWIGYVSALCQWCLHCLSDVSVLCRWYLNYVLVVFWWCFGDVSVISPLCFVCVLLVGWWQLKYLLFSSRSLQKDDPILTSIFFKWVGSTTN